MKKLILLLGLLVLISGCCTVTHVQNRHTTSIDIGLDNDLVYIIFHSTEGSTKVYLKSKKIEQEETE